MIMVIHILLNLRSPNSVNSTAIELATVTYYYIYLIIVISVTHRNDNLFRYK